MAPKRKPATATDKVGTEMSNRLLPGPAKNKDHSATIDALMDPAKNYVWDDPYPGEEPMFELVATFCSAAVLGASKLLVSKKRVAVSTGNWCHRFYQSDHPDDLTRTEYCDSSFHAIWWCLLYFIMVIAWIAAIAEEADGIEYLTALLIILIYPLCKATCCRQMFAGMTFAFGYKPLWFSGVRYKISMFDFSRLEAALRNIREPKAVIEQAAAPDSKPQDMHAGEELRLKTRTKDGWISVTSRRVIIETYPTFCGCCLLNHWCFGSRWVIIDKLLDVGRVEAMATPLFHRADEIGLWMIFIGFAGVVRSIVEIAKDEDADLLVVSIFVLLIGLFLYFFRPFHLAIYNKKLPQFWPNWTKILRSDCGRIDATIRHAIRMAQAEEEARLKAVASAAGAAGGAAAAAKGYVAPAVAVASAPELPAAEKTPADLPPQEDEPVVKKKPSEEKPVARTKSTEKKPATEKNPIKATK